MKKLGVMFILILFLGCVSIISALCEEGQIDINNASKEDLDEITHVGPTVAQYIINARPFTSLNDLVNVSYISSGYLEDIIDQGLACIDGETEEEDEEVEENKEEDIEEEKDNQKNNETKKEVKENKEIEKVKIENIEPNIIKLNAKDIKSENDKENLNKSNYAMYGFVIFCVLLGFLFMLRKKRFNKNEFEG